MFEGALIGAALGIAAGILAAPESGKKLRKDAKNKAAEFYAHLSPKLKKIKRIGEKEYHAAVHEAAKNYGKAKRLTASEQQELAAHAVKSWKHLKKHLA